MAELAMNQHGPHLRGGVIIVGSLLWQDHLKEIQKDGIRRNWRDTCLNLSDKILVRLPIRYGRYSEHGIYTMVFSTICENSNRLGTGLVVPFKGDPIDVDGIISQARKMAKAEGIDCRLVGSWASMGILINNDRVQPEIGKAVLATWAKEFRDDGGGQDTSEYRVGKEKLSITKKGELQIPWPKPVDPNKQSTIDEFDVLIAASTKPRHQSEGVTRYPSATEIAYSVRNDAERQYFLKNYQNTITTFQDIKVINLL